MLKIIKPIDDAFKKSPYFILIFVIILTIISHYVEDIITAERFSIKLEDESQVFSTHALEQINKIIKPNKELYCISFDITSNEYLNFDVHFKDIRNNDKVKVWFVIYNSSDHAMEKNKYPYNLYDSVTYPKEDDVNIAYYSASEMFKQLDKIVKYKDEIFNYMYDYYPQKDTHWLHIKDNFNMQEKIPADILTFSINNGKILKTNIEISDRSLLISNSTEDPLDQETLCVFNVE